MGAFLLCGQGITKEKNMQILIDLQIEEKGLAEPNEEAKKEKKAKKLLELLSKLDSLGYKIHSLSGNFIYDVKGEKAIDVGSSGKYIAPSIELAYSIYEKEEKLALIFVEAKYVAFSDSYFPSAYEFIGGKIRPISIDKALSHFGLLFIEESLETLASLYKEQFDDLRSQMALKQSK